MASQFGRRVYNNHYNGSEADDEDVFLKCLLFQDPKILAEQAANRLIQNGRTEDPLARYYEIKEHLNVFLWNMEDIMEREQSSSQPRPSPSLLDSAAAPASTLETVAVGSMYQDNYKTDYTAKTNNNNNNDTNSYLSKSFSSDLSSSLVALPLPLECIRRVSESGFLTANDLGRLLLLTSPQITHQLSQDFCWNCLCHAKFPQLLSILPRQNPEWIVRQFSKQGDNDHTTNEFPLSLTQPSTSTKWPPLEPPRLKAQDLELIVSWYSNKHHRDRPPTATFTLSGRRLNEFLQRGQVTIATVSKEETDNSVIRVPRVEELDQTAVTIHAVRRCRPHDIDDDHSTTKEGESSTYYQVCCLHETDEYSWDANPALPLNIQHAGDLYMGPQGPILLKPNGKDLETRLAREDREAGGFEILVIGHAVTDERIVESISLQFWANYSDRLYIYNSREQSKKHGVTLLHILDQLEGWQD